MEDFSTALNLSTFRFRKRTPGTFVLVPFPKQGRSIRCQGQLEAAAARILVACPLVDAIAEQPLAIYYTWSEKDSAITLLDGPPTKEFRKNHCCSYVVPDFLVSLVGGRKRLVEIKPSHKLARPLTQRKLCVARLFADTQGWTYHVITERELFIGPLLANVRLLGRFRRFRTDDSLLGRLIELVSTAPLSLAEVLQRFAEIDGGVLRAAVWHLAAVERISVDVVKLPLTDLTILYPEGRYLWDPFVSVWEPSGSTTNGTIASSASSIPTRSSPKI